MLVGNPEESRKAVSDASVYDPSTKSLILELKGIGFSTMDVGESIYTSHTYACLAWKPDFNHLNTDDKLSRALSNVIKSGDDDVIRELLSLAAHKSPHLSVLELNLTPDTVNSLWLEGLGMHTEPRAEILDFHYASAIPEVILGARELYSQSSSQYANFILLDPLNQAFSAPTNVSQLNLILVRIYHSMSASDFHQLSRSLNLLLVDGGSVIFHSCDGEKQVGQKEKDLEDTSTLRDEVAARSFSPADKTDVINILRQNNFRSIRQTPTGIIVAEAVPGGCSETQSDANTRAVFLVRLCSTADDITSEFITRLKNKKWTFTEIQLDGGLLAEQLPAKSTVLILDEISQPVLATATKDQWESIQVIIRKECNILWVTKGSQMEVRNPHHAVCHGVFRTVRAEEPLLRLITLDVESLTMECLSDSVDSIDDCLEELNKQSFKGVGPMECEFAERGGLLHVSRVLPDEGINRVKIEDGPSGVPPVMVDFHTSDSTIRMAAERLGSLDALQFYEVNPNEAARLQRDDVEIEIFASSCNYKDVVVAMGIVPEDQKRLGWDGAGIITRVGTSVTDRHRGQRVGVYRSGCFGNRVTAPRKVTFPIPDSMSFEEAATLPITFATGIYGLYHLANLKRGQRVLIHSAAGGVGIACIQLCQRLDCEIFATVGSSEKRQFLTAEFGIQEDHIFSSRSPAFARGVRQVTQGYGVDVVVNSLTGNLLDDSWRLLAPHGTLIQIAKKDSFDRNCLSMEPFAFNCSFRSLDISILPLDTFQE
jgi:NADPH:quinone reductase-like Zn-dependent oxidoreductase